MADPVYTKRARLPVFLTRGRDNAIEIAIYDSAGDIAAPASGTIDIYRADGQRAVDGAAVVVLASKATYTVPAAALPATQSFSGLWQVRWHLAYGGATYTFEEPAHLVRWILRAPAAEADLTDRHQDIADLIDTGDDLSQFLRVAWEQIVRRLLRDSRAPSLILDSFALMDLQVYKALEALFMDAASSAGSGRYQELAEHYAGLFEAEWGQITWTYDADGDGLPDADERGTAGSPSLWLAPARG